MYHGSVVCSVYRLANTGFLALHQAQFVHSVIHPQWQQFVPREPLPKDKTDHFQTDKVTWDCFKILPVWILPSPFSVKEEH